MSQIDHTSPARIPTAVLLLLMLGAAVGRTPSAESQSAGSTAEQIVTQFFPVELTNGPEVTPGSWVEQTRKSAFVILESLPDGRPSALLAAYTNGIRGAVRVIQAQADDSYQVSYEPSSLDFGGLNVSAELVDLDGDSHPEAIVSFSTFRVQTVEWIFRWTGTSLENLTPMLPEELGSRASQLVLSKFIDLDHDGKLEIISEENYPPQYDESGFALGGSQIFKLGAEGYVLDRPILYWITAVRRTGAPRTDTYEFTLLADSTGPYTLKLVNGDANGGNRISSAHIVVNGTEVLSPNQFSQQVHFLDIPLNLTKTNTLQVTVAGTPLGQIWITIQDEAAVQRAQQPSGQP